MKRSDVHLAVVGAGPYGLETAAWALQRGYRLTLFERQAEVGGDWLRWGNTWSRLQSHRDGYLFSGPVAVPGEDALPAYPTREQMLAYFNAYATVTGVAEHICFECTVTGRSALRDGKVALSFVDREGIERSAEFTHIFAAPGRVNRRRELRLPGEASFSGRVARGSGCDLADAALAGKHVLILGHGSFALENARHALEQHAATVVLLARHEQLVMSRAAGFLVDRHADKVVPAHAVFEALRRPYELVGTSGDAALGRLFYAPCKTMLPTSDFFFLARACGRLRVTIGELARVEADAVQTTAGERITADVLIKCIGFAQDIACAPRLE